MKLVIEKIPALQGLYARELRLLLGAEEMTAIKAARMADTAEDPELMHLFREHIDETYVHASRLREILQRTGGETGPLKCRVVYSLFDEVEDLIEAADNAQVRDAALAAEAQRIEHYEIAAYGALRQFARTLGIDEDDRLLVQSLSEEERASQQLTLIAERIYLAARSSNPIRPVTYTASR
jgi:ferritin-like metal-binding protein YciE